MDMPGIAPVLAAAAIAFALGAAFIFAVSRNRRLQPVARDLWALYGSEFVIVGALLVPAAIGAWVFAVVMAAFVWRASVELFGLFDCPARGFAFAAVTIAGIAVIVAAMLGGEPALTAISAAAAGIGIAVAVVTGRNRKDMSVKSAAAATLVVALFAAMILVLRKGVYGFAFLGFVYGTVEIADAFALLIGKLFGRTLLIPRLSPRKTVEGFAGGLVAGWLGGFVLARYLFGLAPAQSWLPIAIVLAAGTLGDLVTSALKRARGKKDFPPVLAAHGGVIDIYDSFLFAAPAFLIWNST